MSARAYFVILGAMRTGSNFLEKSLAALDGTICYGEAFNPAFLGEPRFKTMLGWTKDDRDADPIGFLEALIHGHPDRTAGFRLFDGHCNPILQRVTRDPACRAIVLRRDPVDSYVSLKIAQRTGQWLLTDERRRMQARIQFDVNEFTAYRARLAEHYQVVDQNIADNGTACLEVTYSDLSSAEKLRRIAEHVGASGSVTQAPEILKQNPERLAEKVINYEEMCDFLGRKAETGPPKKPVSAEQVLVPEQPPLAYAPIAGPGFVAAVSLIDRLGQHKFGVPALPYGQTMARADQGELHPSGFDPAALRGLIAERPVFTIVCHPLLRLHRLFLADIFGRGWRFSTVRRLLVEELGDWPDPKKRGDDADPLLPGTHRRFFSRYLRMIVEARAGQGAAVMRPEWATQMALVAAYRADARLDKVCRLENVSDLIDWLADRMGVGPVPATHARVSLARAATARMPMDDVLTPQIVAEARKMDAEDYEAFGYPDFPETA